MIDDRSGKDLKLFPELEEPQIFIYIMRNELGKVKVGLLKTFNKDIKLYVDLIHKG